MTLYVHIYSRVYYVFYVFYVLCTNYVLSQVGYAHDHDVIPLWPSRLGLFSNSASSD